MIARSLTAALLITAAESLGRRLLRSRAIAWLAGYAGIGGYCLLREFAAATTARPAVPRPESGNHRTITTAAGVAVALAGYPAGRLLLGDRPRFRPRDPLPADLLALAVVAAAEELAWGRRIEPVAGIGPAAILFALKHVVIDRRPRRALGLFLFWLGLATLRRQSPVAALALHVASNTAGVVIGHWTDRDQF